MLALRTTSKISPLLNSALNRYTTRPFDYPCGIYRGGIFTRRLMIGESLGVQAFDAYRNFFLYHSIAPYTVPALRYSYGVYPYHSSESLSDYFNGFFGLFWGIGAWFVTGIRSFIGYFFPSLGPKKIILKLAPKVCENNDKDASSICQTEKSSDNEECWELVENSRSEGHIFLDSL